MRLIPTIMAAALACGGALIAQDIAKDPAFQHFYNLEYEEALALFTKRAATDPQDPNVHNHIAQTVLYWEMFRNGALESELVTGTNPFVRRPNLNVTTATTTRFHDSIAKVMEICRARIEKDANDTKAMYAMGVAYGLRANWNFLVKKGWRDSLRDATEARKLHNRVSEIDANFVDARFVQAVHDYVVGSLPLTYKILGFLVGFRGDRDEGMKMLRFVAEKGNLNRADSAVLLSAILRREKRAREAVPLLEGLIKQFPRNYLFRLELSTMYGDIGDKTNAIAQLDQLEKLRAAGAVGLKKLSAERIDYAKGNVYFWYDDLDQALAHLTRATAKAQAFDLNTGALTWMRLGQTYDLKGDRDQAKRAYAQAVKLAPQSDLAKESLEYINSPYRRKKKG